MKLDPGYDLIIIQLTKWIVLPKVIIELNLFTINGLMPIPCRVIMFCSSYVLFTSLSSSKNGLEIPCIPKTAKLSKQPKI